MDRFQRIAALRATHLTNRLGIDKAIDAGELSPLEAQLYLEEEAQHYLEECDAIRRGRRFFEIYDVDIDNIDDDILDC